jgi:hypothetical protein
MFGILKTKGFNLEDMHLANTDRLFTLLAGLGLAVALSVKPGAAAPRRRTIPIIKHGRRAWPLSALGLSALRKIFGAANPPQASTFLRQLLSPKTRTQLIEISSTLKESPVRWRSLMSSDQSSKIKDIVRISGFIENVDLQLRIELSFQPCK